MTGTESTPQGLGRILWKGLSSKDVIHADELASLLRYLRWRGRMPRVTAGFITGRNAQTITACENGKSDAAAFARFSRLLNALGAEVSIRVDHRKFEKRLQHVKDLPDAVKPWPDGGGHVRELERSTRARSASRGVRRGRGKSLAPSM